MKRKISVVVLVLFLVLVIFGSTISSNFEEFLDWKQIYDDRITEQEQLDFETLLNTKTLHYYNCLNSEQQQAYIMMYSMFCNFTESRRFEIAEEEISDVLMAVLYDNSEIFWVCTNYRFADYGDSVEFLPEYRLLEDYQRISVALNEKIKEIVKGSEKLSTDYEKELYFHNYICENVVYDENTITQSGAYGDTAHSALLDGKSICEGYSRAMQLLLDHAGIDNYLVVGDGVSEDGIEPHMWNVVEIDGEKYHIDVTWDDTFSEEDYGYLYFNVNDEFITRDHKNLEPNDNNCVSMDANYFVVNDLYVVNFESFNDLILPVSQSLKISDNTVEILFADEKQFSKAMKSLKNNNYAFFDFIGDSVEFSDKNLQKDKIEYYTIDESYYLCLIFKEG